MKILLYYFISYSVWCLFKIGDIKEIEKIQKRDTKLVIKLKNKPYSDRLIYLNLPTLKYRCLRGDMIEVFKITHNTYDTTVPPEIPFNERQGNNYKLHNHSFHYDLQKHFSLHVLLISGTPYPNQLLMLALLTHLKCGKINFDSTKQLNLILQLI